MLRFINFIFNQSLRSPIKPVIFPIQSIPINKEEKKEYETKQAFQVNIFGNHSLNLVKN